MKETVCSSHNGKSGNPHVNNAARMKLFCSKQAALTHTSYTLDHLAIGFAILARPPYDQRLMRKGMRVPVPPAFVQITMKWFHHHLLDRLDLPSNKSKWVKWVPCWKTWNWISSGFPRLHCGFVGGKKLHQCQTGFHVMNSFDQSKSQLVSQLWQDLWPAGNYSV